MASPYEMFETDETMEQEGIILDYGDFRIRIAHAGGSNKKFSKLLDRRLKPYERQLAAKTMDNDVAAKILREVYAETIVLGFEVKAEKGFVSGVPVKDGNPATYSIKEVVRIFTEIPRLFIDVKQQAEDFALFRSVEQEEAAKN